MPTRYALTCTGGCSHAASRSPGRRGRPTGLIGCGERLVHGVRRQERVVHDTAYPRALPTNQPLNCRNDFAGTLVTAPPRRNPDTANPSIPTPVPPNVRNTNRQSNASIPITVAAGAPPEADHLLKSRAFWQSSTGAGVWVAFEEQLVNGRYRLLGHLGRGATSLVWRARDERLDRVVAVKQFLREPSTDPGTAAETCDRALREARLASR